MGWDAEALRNGQPIAIASRQTPDYWSSKELPLREAFQLAVKRVSEKVGGAPEYLRDAQLSGSYERLAFEHIFGVRFDNYPNGNLAWSAEELQKRAACACWTTPDDEFEASAFWTVKEFVIACVENGLGIHFSY